MELDKIDEAELTDQKILEGLNYSSEVLDAVSSYLGQIGKYEVYNKEYLIELIKRYKNGEHYLKEKIINHNLRLVVAVVKRLRTFRNSEEFLDSIQDGNIGLMIALEKYDSYRGNAFSTYAVWWIRQQILSKFQNNFNTVRIPIHLQEKLNKYKRYKNEYYKTYGKYPTKEEIIDELKISDITLDLILEIENSYSNIDSLNRILDLEDKSNNAVESIFPDYEMGYNEVENSLNDKILLVILKQKLTSREYYIIYNRYVSDSKIVLEEIGEEFFLTRERIRQIEAAALKK